MLEFLSSRLKIADDMASMMCAGSGPWNVAMKSCSTSSIGVCSSAL